LSGILILPQMPIPIPYDIFRKDSHGVPVWVEAVPDLERAQLRVVELDKEKPGDYMIFSQTTGSKIVVKDGLPEPGAAS